MSSKSSSGSMQSNVGNRQIYEASEQRPNPSDRHPAERLTGSGSNEEPDKTVQDIHKPSRTEFTEPSHGAKIDAELQRDDEELLRQKGKI